MNKILQWLRSSLEGNDGKSSAKMITLLWITILSTALHVFFMVIAFRIVEKEAPTAASLQVMDRIRDLIALDWLILLILFGVATIASLIQLFKIIRGQPTTDEPILTETVTKNSTTVTEIKPKLNEQVQTDTSNSNAPASDS